MRKSPPFPYPECLEEHTLDFCEDKDCEYLGCSADFCNYWCNLVLEKLEEQHPWGQSTFRTSLQKYGNSYVLRVPPKVAMLYDLKQEFRATIEKTCNKTEMKNHE